MPAEPDGYDVQLAKVQRPALRDETLERPRLLDWLRAKIHGRVVLLLADAGYGKTTLLADFSRRTRLRTLWYRLDETIATGRRSCATSSRRAASTTRSSRRRRRRSCARSA